MTLRVVAPNVEIGWLPKMEIGWSQLMEIRWLPLVEILHILVNASRIIGESPNPIEKFTIFGLRAST